MANKKLSLLEQVHIKEKENELSKKTAIKADMNGSEMLRVLLPNYDQQIIPARFHAATQSTKVLRGGVRSGKTYSLEANAILLSYLNRPYYHISLSPTFALAKMTVVKVLEELCEKNNLQYYWKESDQEFRIYWGSSKKDIATILIIGADQAFKGITAASGDANEPFSIAKDKYLVWYERISHPDAVRLERDLGGTAEPEKMSWGHSFYKMKSNKKIYLDTMTTYDNKYLSKEYISSLEDQYDARMRRVYMLGENINLSGLSIYYSFDEQVNVYPFQQILDRVKQQQENRIIISLDFNVNPICGTETWINGMERIQVDEYRIQTSNTWEISELISFRIRERYDLRKTLFIITGDATGQKKGTRSQDVNENDYTIVKQVLDRNPEISYTFRVPESNPFVSDRTKYINRQFEKKLYGICDNCKYSIDDRNLMKWKAGGEGLIVDKSNKAITHLADAGDYALYNLRILTDTPGIGQSSVWAEYSDRW